MGCAKRHRSFLAFVAAVPLTLAPVFAQSSQMFNVDAQRAAEARQQYQQYQQQVDDYARSVRERLSEARGERADIEVRYARLERELAHMNKQQRQEAQAELNRLGRWLRSESAMSAEAERNVNLCQRWLDHYKARAHDADYNVDQDQQTMLNEQKRQRQLQETLAWEQRRDQGGQYYQNAFNTSGGYGGGYGGRGYRGRRLGGWGHTSHAAHAPSVHLGTLHFR